MRQSYTKVLGLLVLVLAATGCASTNPLGVSDAEAAFVRNRVIKDGQATIGLPFIKVDDKPLSTGLRRAPKDVEYTIPSGGSTLIFRVVYKPEFWATRWYQRYFSVYLEAEPGQTYQANARIDEPNNRIDVWIEDLEGNQVTPTATAELGPTVEEQIYKPVDAIMPRNW